MPFSNRGELKTAIRGWLVEESADVLSDSDMNDAISFVESDLNYGVWGPQQRQFRVFETQAVKFTTITADDEEYISLPNGFITMRYVVVTTSQDKQTLEYATPEDFIDRQTDSGDTSNFTISNQQLRVKPTLAKSDQVEMGYYQEVPALDSDTASNWLLAQNPQIYQYGAITHLSPNLFSAEALQRASSGYERAVLNKIVSDARRQVAEGPVTLGSHEQVA